MPARSLTVRVDILEQDVEGLQTLPDRMTGLESQILQFRVEMRDGFSAILTRLHEGDEESRRQMRVLHEDVISRIALLQDLSAGSSPGALTKAKGRGRRKR